MAGTAAERMLRVFAPTKEDSMDRKSVARLALELTDRHDLAGREGLMTEDATFTIPGQPPLDRAGSSAFSRPMLAAFPDGRHQIDLVIEDGDHVLVEGVWLATHTEPLATPDGEVPATGRPVTLPFAMVVTFDGDRAKSLRIYFDQLAFLGQLGLIPAPQAA